MRDRMKIHFCGPTGTNAVDAAIKLCKTATGRGDIISFQGGFHGSGAAGMALTGWSSPEGAREQRCAWGPFLPLFVLCRVPVGPDPGDLQHELRRPTSSIHSRTTSAEFRCPPP